MDEISITNVPDQNVISIRKQGSYGIIPQLLQSVYEYAISQGAEFTGPPMYICHEQCVEEIKKADEDGTADIEIAIPLGKEIEATEEIKYYQLKGGSMAKILHKGPYTQCEATYQKLFHWIQQQGKMITGPTREVYLNDPHEVEEEDILTEIYAPIA